MVGWENRWLDGRIDGWMDEEMVGWENRWFDGWIDGWMDEKMEEWLNRWLQGWEDGLMDVNLLIWNTVNPQESGSVGVKISLILHSATLHHSCSSPQPSGHLPGPARVG